MKELKSPVHLTDKDIRGIEPREKRIEVFDAHNIVDGKLKQKGVKGLALRVSPKGNKSFIYKYYYNGKMKGYTIGSYPEWSLSGAREKARELLKVKDNGKDPALLKQKNKNAITLGEYIEIFKGDYMPRKLKASTQKTYKSRLNKVTSDRIADLPLKDIDRQRIRQFLKGEAKEYPTNANRLQAILSKVFNEAILDGYMLENPLKGMEKLTEENSRDVQYQQDDIKAIWDAIQQEWEPMQSLLKMLLITGQRLGETSRMKWADIHNRTWIIPKTDTKNKSVHKIPLPNMALNVLKKMKAINDSSEYVFASQRDKTGHVSEFGNVIKRLRKETMLNDFRIHDLRHIVATKMIDLDVPFIHVGKVLNHKGLSAKNAITSRYVNTGDKKEMEQKANALNIWAGELTKLTTNLRIADHG